MFHLILSMIIVLYIIMENLKYMTCISKLFKLVSTAVSKTINNLHLLFLSISFFQFIFESIIYSEIKISNILL